MSINLNSIIAASLPEALSMSSRAIFYGDGLFETIRVFRGKIPFMPLHWERLANGLSILGFEIPSEWSAIFFEKEILRVAQGNARVRISVWRAPGGFYAPTDNTPNFLITATPMESDVFNWQETGLTIRLCERVRLPIDALSGLKTLGGVRYVAAAMEARAKGVDDVIVLNERGQICEASNSNILWIKGETVYAPSPTDGQVSGTFQKILSGVLQAEGIQIVEKPTTFAELLEADEVFLTNAVQGIRWVRLLEEKVLICYKTKYFNKLAVKHLERFFSL